ncbi:YggS family pyridoxal phosphate-dependent enzyme [Sporanaerobium hydrogeniformans]|uniref:YggS family pyridoxal phosphate-dependent enzyme n=1 Tax=Sporanaerobium hydrogeniformans TaxID=3072179 RepID=A0AC61DDK2_9FIRM|nr:YggS family pyridoxal phosphate-dependent enzyme [Sporanaerobium hydrogeniformans]PHV71133.1 YggS family pyridoxal phosphate-dependent enzyme [Sporanaerobium hydrogeniformans]
MMKEQLESIQHTIKKAAEKSGRKEEDITLIAVSKTYPASAIQEAIALGCKDFGENKVQELVQKIESIEEPVNWHMIGHLQTNKVKYIIGKTALVHSVDSLKLLKEIQKQSLKKDVITSILLEVNVAQEDSKSGILLEEAMDYASSISKLSHVRCEGLMTVAPYVENPEDNRLVFRQLYDLSVDMQKQKFDNINMHVLSMGMSNDYWVAIEEGATMVRIGTALFGARNYT